MILYLDTSAYLKLYVDEAKSELVRSAAKGPKVTSHVITYAEIRAGLARALRLGRLPPDAYRYQLDQFERDGCSTRVIAADETLIRRAGDLAETHGLRGYDSVHLAAAEAVWRAVPGVDFRVGVFDGALTEAVRALGMTVLVAD